MSLLDQLDKWTDHPRLRILITGSQTWQDEQLISDVLGFVWELNGMLTVVHGDCPKGADRIAREWCERMNDGAEGAIGGPALFEERHPADWDRLGKRAGMARNKEMVLLGADVVFAFHKDLSPGTQNTIDLARKAEIPVEVFSEKQ